MRDAIDYEVVLWRIVVFNAVELDVFRDDIAATLLINAVNYCLRERLFPAYENSYPLHICLIVLSRKKRKIPAPLLLVKQASVASACRIHETADGGERAFYGACVTIRPQCLAFPGWRRQDTAS